MPAGTDEGARDTGLRTPWGTIAAFLLPALIVYVAFTAYPALRTIWNSFHKVLPRREEAVGLANYAELVADDIFWRAVRNTITWACTSPLVEVSIALLPCACPLRPGAGCPFLPRGLVHAGADVLRGGRHPLAVDLQFRLGAGERRVARARARRLGQGLARRSQTAPAVPDLRHQLDVGRLHMVVLLAALHSLPRR
jgi:multiple sugar transport system permease protein/raffinose/stachyose/melibiose transport system permease protein